MISRILILLTLFFISLANVLTVSAVTSSVSNDKLNLREVQVGDTGNQNNLLETFISPIRNFFFQSDTAGGEGVLGGFVLIAYNIKNAFIAIAVIFLIFSVIKLLFSSNTDEDAKKWRNSIIWISVGIFVMQIAYSVWSTMILSSRGDFVDARLGWQLWKSVLEPLVNLMYLLASLAFLLMAVWAFYRLATAAGDEEKIKKGKYIIFYALLGFLLIRVPLWIVRTIYGSSPCEKSVSIGLGGCDRLKPDLAASIGIVGKIFSYLNTFLAIFCVIMIIYAGWLVFISAGEEEKLKKAKNIVIYIIIGFILLIASHAIFRFFILQG